MTGDKELTVRTAAEDAFGSLKKRRLTMPMLVAMDQLAAEEIPLEAIKTRPGKGGKTFDYVSHIWVTQKLRDAFGVFWSMNVKDYEVFNDNSAVAVVELIIYAPTSEDEEMEVSITEVGAFEDATGKMPKAMIVASAVSRGLCRCVMRRFGIGKQFYDEESEPTLASAWESIKRHAERQKLTPEEVLQLFEMNGITRSNLLDEFTRAWRLVTVAAQRKADQEVSFEVGDKEQPTAAEVREGEPGAEARASASDN